MRHTPNADGFARRLRDDRGIVVSWMAKLIVTLAIFGLAFVEGGAIVFSKLQAQDIADSAAVQGAATFGRTKDLRAAREAAILLVGDRSGRAEITSFTVLPDGNVNVTIELRANTVLVHQLDFLEDLTISSATATATPPTANV